MSPGLINGVAPSITAFVKSESRDLSLADGNVAYTGYGFTPRGLIIFAFYYAAVITRSSWGYSDNTKSCLSSVIVFTAAGAMSSVQVPNFVISAGSAVGSAYSQANVVSYDTDGYTLSWTKTGAPTGTLTFTVIALK